MKNFAVFLQQSFFMQLFHRSITKETLILALPVMLTQLGQVSVNIVDNIIVGRLLGADALASVSLGNAVFFSLFIFGVGISFAIPPLVSEASAKNNTRRIQAVFEHGFVLNTTVGVILMLLLLMFIPLLYHLNQPEHILPDTSIYLRIMAFSILPFMLFQTLRETSEGLGFTIGVTIATIIANLINILFDYIFIKGLFGIPSMGVAGAGYATLLARGCMFFFLLFIMWRNPKTKQYILDFSLKMKGFKKTMFQKMLRLGFPTALQMFFEVTAFAGAAFICGLVSAKDIAAHQIALSMASFTFNLCIGFSVASTVLVGRSYGKKDYKSVKQIGINNISLTFIYMAMCGLMFIIFKENLPQYFTKDNETAVLNLASQLLIIAALFQLSDGVQVTTLGALRGLQDVKIPSIITFIAYWVITIPLGYYLCVTRQMGALGMWIALGIGLTLSAAMLIYRFLKMLNKRLAHE